MDHISRIKSKLLRREQAKKVCEALSRQGKTVVFTNGCFDVVHYGHVKYLAKAAELGDVLVIGLNTDESVKQIKGENRPVNPMEARQWTLAALEFVDYVIPFDENTPYELIREVKPNVLVKGKDYNEKDVVGHDLVKANGGSVKTIELEKGFSTSSIIEKLKNTTSENK